jgi:hypothetical protein
MAEIAMELEMTGTTNLYHRDGRIKASVKNIELLCRALSEAQRPNRGDDAQALQDENLRLRRENTRLRQALGPKLADAPDFAQTVPRMFHVGGAKFYNQEGWLFDPESQEPVGFWNGKDIETVVDEDSDDEN